MAKKPKMKVPGHHVSLALTVPMDVYRKLEWECGLLETSLMANRLAPVYCLMNAAITAWHLGDWTAAALDEKGAWDSATKHFGETVRCKHDLQMRMLRSTGLRACQQLAAAAKHMTIETPTYKEGFKATDQFQFFGGLDDGVQQVKRWITVTFPAEIDGLVTRQQTSSMGAVLGDACMWWEQTLRGLGMWNDLA